MTQQLEFEGNNVEKAAIAASEALSIPREKLQYQVISYGSTGIFGLVGTKKARIRVILPKEKAKSDSDRSDRANENKVPLAAGSHDPEEKNRSAKADIVSHVEDRDPKAVGLDTLNQITNLISEGADIEVESNSERLLFNIRTKDAAVLIGKRGQTLEAIQYLTEKIINKQCGPHAHIQVDIEGYLKKRQENLENLASRMAEKVTRTKKPISIGKMSAYERRIVHLSLKEDNRVRTQSKGDGYLRKLIIFPIKNQKNRKQQETFPKEN